ncbi:hypothetical protein JCM3775_002681 [Rhodotorula graminis]|uniref:RNase III domain-containing protein n=1 Tax=Rhodotorula graminis (strain WP1) TaxID=578459 RepID=A0A194S4X8_RHOGW|nr:uncharacterized protein RHOBADRAFT_43216 [Rhodotorula graminis WP1]KPV75793.1 hypothetical protein RHOBADRAFT_43216 [Rhodotorula graminis WP1]
MDIEERLKALRNKAPSLHFYSHLAKGLATTALTHSSLSATHNNTELARLGEAVSRAVATKALYLAPGPHTGSEYNSLALAFSTKALSPIARDIELDKVLRVGRGTSHVSDEMVSRALVALLGALELASGPDALLTALKELGILKLPEARDDLSDGVHRFSVDGGEVRVEPL